MSTNQRVGRVMTESVLSIDVEESASEVLRLFAGYPIHHLPVLSGQAVVGMLSSADVMKLDAFLPKGRTLPEGYLDGRIRLTTLMSKPVITIEADEPLTEAAKLMAAHGIHALPVVDGQRRLLGIITTTDIMHAALQEKSQSRTPTVSVRGVAPGDLRLTATAFDQAVTAAKAAVESGQDGENIATALLILQRRLGPLERLLQIADRYLNCGQERSQKVELLKAIGEVKRTIPGAATDEHPPLGLVAG
jgi:CBS domain-containing membrane protein